jgi:integrase
MRRGEITGLTWDRVNLQLKFVSLHKTKNGDGRQVPLSPAALEILSKLKEFKKPFDVEPDTISTLFRRACQQSGIDNAHFHDARATATVRLSKKVDVLSLARIIGHRDIKSLMIYYRETASELAEKLV